MSWLSEFFLGSEGEVNWDELARMIELQAETNKTDRTGVFTGWEWERDSEGNPLNRQVQTINPAFQAAVDRLGYNAGKPADPYTMPSQFSQMLDAKMNNQMNRMGMDTSGYAQQQAEAQPGEWIPSADRPGVQDPGAFLPPPPGTDPGDPPPSFVVPPSLPPVQEAPPPDPEPGAGLPLDYYNDKGNVRRKYRPGNRNYVGDEEMRRWAEDPNYAGPNLPADYYNDKGNVRRRYRGQEYYSNPYTEDAIFGTGTGAPDDWLNDKGNIRRRYREGANQYIGPEYQDPNWVPPDDLYNDKGRVRRKYRTSGG